MNPVKKVKKAIRNRKRKKRWKEMKHDLCYLSMDVLNVMSHAMAMPDGGNPAAPEIVPEIRLSMLINRDPQ